MPEYQALIIGGGPAGVSAALYLSRADIRVALVENGGASLVRAPKIENYYGIALAGAELYAAGLAQARAAGVEIIRDEVLGASYLDAFSLALKNRGGELRAPVLILATGTKNLTLRLPGAEEFAGRGVSYCSLCDGFFFRRKKVAVLGNGPFALHEAEQLRPLAASVTILANGGDDAAAREAGFACIKTPLRSLAGSGKLEEIHFADGSSVEMDGLFIALGTADSTDLARQLGAGTSGRFIKADADGRTNIPGLFAAGDCAGGLKQVAKAVYEGARAGIAATEFLRAARNS